MKKQKQDPRYFKPYDGYEVIFQAGLHRAPEYFKRRKEMTNAEIERIRCAENADKRLVTNADNVFFRRTPPDLKYLIPLREMGVLSDALTQRYITRRDRLNADDAGTLNALWRENKHRLGGQVFESKMNNQ